MTPLLSESTVSEGLTQQLKLYQWGGQKELRGFVAAEEEAVIRNTQKLGAVGAVLCAQSFLEKKRPKKH